MRERQWPTPSRDLDNRSDITEMVRRFYVDVAQDDLLGPMFNDVAKVDWTKHLEKLTDYWARTLLGTPGYEGNPYRAHTNVHRQCPFTTAHFEQWLSLFYETLDLGWVGPRTEQARRFAAKVARVHSRQLVGATVDACG